MSNPSNVYGYTPPSGVPTGQHDTTLTPLVIYTSGINTPDSQPMSPGTSSSNPMSPTLMSPGVIADSGRNVAVDYMKSRYESVDKRQEVKKLPEIVRQPKKLGGEWDKMLDEKTKRQEENKEGTIKEQDILAMVFACAGIDTKSQYMTLMAEKEASSKDVPANRQPVEKVAPPEITKTVRNMFESGNMADLHNQQKRLQTYEMTPGSGVFENEPIRPEGVIRSGEQQADEETAVQRGLTKSLLSQWQNMGGGDAKKEDVLDGEQILKGTTKSLLNQWSIKASTESAAPSLERKMIKIHATDGTVCESRPVKRMDVVRAEDLADDESEKVQTGMTKSLLNQWKTKGSEEFKAVRREVINIADGEGKVVENMPTRRNDVIRENDVIEADGEAVCSGQTKSLLSQWKTKGSEQFKIERKPINIAEDDRTVAENEPTHCLDAVNAFDIQSSDDAMIEKGFTRSLVSQWKTKDLGEFVSARKIINIAEDEGKILESVPILRTDVVREEDIPPEKCVQQGITKNLLGHFKTIGTQEFKKDRNPIIIATGAGTVAENEPEIRSDVVHEYDISGEGEEVKQGFTKTLLSQWKTKGSEEFRSERKPINIADGEGKVSENEPTRRLDVAREDYNAEVAITEQIKQNSTKALRSQWIEKGQQEFRKSKSPIVLAEAEGTIAENEPVVRTDVVREYDIAGEEQVQRGTAKMMRDKWSNKASEEFSRERTPIVLPEGEAIISENQPVVRGDVIRADYDATGEKNQIQQGITSTLKSQWMNKSSVEYKKDRTPILITEGEGVVSENQPTVRTDVVREYNDCSTQEEAQVQRGTTKQLLNQWKSKGTEEFRSERKTIVITRDEGNVSENDPVRRTDVIREDDSVTEGELIQKGLTKNLTSQWKAKGSETFQIERPPINIAEGDGGVHENEPTKRSDVIREDASYGEENIQRGFTKNLMSQWKTKGSEEFRIARPPINIAEAEGTVSESEPIKRSDVVREDASYGEENIQRGFTKSLTSQWKTKGSETFQSQRPPINIADGEGSVSENEPIKRNDVIRADDSCAEENIQRGFTKNLTSQWKTKGSEGFKINRAPINIAEGEGTVSENEPKRRSDVVREDATYGEEIIQAGLTKNLTNQWKTKGSEGFQIQRAPINIAEGEGTVSENEPIKRSDVVREDATYGEEIIQRGLTKSLTSQWKTKGSEGFHIQKAPINISEGEGTVSENEPIKRSDVVREDATYGEEVIQQGLTKNLTSQWKTKGSEGFQIQRAPINIAEGEGSVSENDPVKRSDVVREDATYGEEIIQRGHAKNLTNQWKAKGSEGFKIQRAPIKMNEGDGTVSENDPIKRNDVVREDASYGEENIQKGLAKNLANQWKSKGSEGFQIQRAPINIAEGEGTVSENEPTTRSDVVRQDASYGEEIIQRGLTKNLTSQWKTKGSEEFRIARAPINIAEGEGMVSENEPIQRSDVTREDASYGEENIQSGFTKTLTSQWKAKGSEEFRIERKPITISEGEGSVSENVPTRRDDVVREDASYGEENIKMGFTKSLTNQWSCGKPEGCHHERSPINIAEGEGSVSENTPTRRNDVVREDDHKTDEQIQAGITKNLLSQWKSKGDEEFRIERSPINIAEGEGTVSENEPTQRSDVVREDISYGEENIQKGFTKKLTSQWKTKGAETFNLERSPINILEGEGKVCENEPTQRIDVVREDASYGEDKIKRGLAKTLTSQWKTKGSEEFRIERSPINIIEGEGTISENEPIRRNDVIRADDYDSEERIQKGFTKNMTSQWKTKGTEEFHVERAPINLAEGEGKISENQPTCRTDVVRESAEYGENIIQKGLTKNLTSQWKTKGTEAFNLERSPINILEGEGKVCENEPTQRIDVVREDASYGEDKIERGLAKSLTSQWKSKGSEEFRIERSPINIIEGEGTISENEPIRRNDVIRADDYDSEEHIQKGFTKNLTSQWKTKGTEKFRVERPPINLAEGEGKISENQPTCRTDVVRESAEYGEEIIQKGLTKNLTSQWKTKGSEEYRIERVAINISEGEGKVSENEPTKRTDVVREDASYGEDSIQKGLTKNLRSQWTSKGSEEFKIERSPIKIDEGEEIVCENNPTRRSDVVREEDCNSNDKIKRGFTKNLTNQWKTKGFEEFNIERSPINIAEGEGVVSENQPARRMDVVREDDSYGEENIQTGLTKNLTSQWKMKGSEEFKIERSPINICEGEGLVSENEPTRRSDVVREDASYGEETIQRGITKTLTNQWKTEGTKEFKIERSPINVAEGEGNDSENNPIRRSDVIREEDNNVQDRIKRGFTKNLTTQWKAKGTEEFRVERSPINWAEDEGKVSENEPTRRTDVIREYDENYFNGDAVQRGTTQNLLSQWKTKGTQEFYMERQPIVISEGEGQIVENEPVRRSDALREEDNMEDIWLKKGFTKDLAGFWMAPEPPRESKGGQMIEIEQGSGVVSENQPTQLIGVTRENDFTDEVMGQRGQIQNIAGRFLTVEDGPRKRKEQIVIDLAEGPSVLENNPAPVRADITRCDEYTPDMLEAGVTKNLVQRWKTGEIETASPKISGFDGQLGTSAWIAEIEQAPGSGVFENEPEVRRDVIRETDYAPEMIPIKQTRNTRKMWTRREQEEGMEIHDERPAQLICFTPPRERSPPAEDFKSYQSITLSSGVSTPSAGGPPKTTPPQSGSPWMSPSSPPDSSQRGSTQLQLLPTTGSSGSSSVNKAQQQRQIKQQQLLLQQKLEQQLLEQQRRYQLQQAALLKRQESLPERQHLLQNHQQSKQQPNRQVSLDQEYNGSDHNQLQQKQFNHTQQEHLQQQQYIQQNDHRSIMPFQQNHKEQQHEHFVQSSPEEKTLRSSATLVLNLKQN